MPFDFDPMTYLKEIGHSESSDIDLSKAALALASFSHPGISLQRYIHHCQSLNKDVAARFSELIEAGAAADTMTQLAALKHVFVDIHGYRGDSAPGLVLENNDVIRVIERMKGSSFALCILYMNAAQAQGWDICGIDMPGRFLCRMEHAGQRVVFDPFSGAEVLEAPKLRMLIKTIQGDDAELRSEYFDAIDNRGTLVCSQNVLKHYYVEQEDYNAALHVVTILRMIAPQEYRLCFDAGALFAKMGQDEAAIQAFEMYIAHTPDPNDRFDAMRMVEEIRARLL